VKIGQCPAGQLGQLTVASDCVKWCCFTRPGGWRRGGVYWHR